MRLGKFFGTALVLTLGTASIACSSGSRAGADSDGDGRPDVVDLCPGTTNAIAGPDGCAKGEDGDADGLDTGDDLCPGTPTGADVDAYGCSAEQRAAGVGAGVFGGATRGVDERLPGEAPDGVTSGDSQGNEVDVAGPLAPAASTAEEAQALLDDPPETGSVRNGFVALVVDRQSDRPLVFFTFASNVTTLENGYEVHGALLLTTPLGQVPIANASVVFEKGDDPKYGLERVRGFVGMPFPVAGALRGFEVDDLVTASIGLDWGKNLKDLEAPIHDDRKYLFFHYQTGFEARSGPISITLPGAADATLIFDPFDPFLFARGSLLGLSALGPVEDVALGLSARGRIPFAPETTFELGAGIEPFEGQLYFGGSVPLARLPMTLSGHMVLDIDPNGDGRPLGAIDQAGMELGLNGDVALTASFLDILSFEAPIGQATVGLRVTGDEQQAYLSGVIEPDQSFLPDELPLRAEQTIEVAGFISSEIEDSYLVLEGEYRMVGSSLTQKVGVDLSDLAVAEARLDVDRRGFRLAGTMRVGVTLAKDLEIGGGAAVEAFFADDPADFYVRITGDVTVAGQELFDARVRMDAHGLFVEGELDTGVSRIAVTGFITQRGAELGGEASVHIPVQTGKKVLETLVDGAICGYEAVTDGAKCGYEVVSDGAVCGYEKVTDGAVCGYQTVTNGAVCGYQTVTSGALCGYQTVTSGVLCGTHEVCKWLGAIGIHVCDDAPNTCSVPKTCTDPSAPKTCTDLSLPKTCNDLAKPKTCADLARPKTCADLEKPRTCEHESVIPDFDYGTLEGKIALSLGTRGLSGEVSGDYCESGGGCTRLAGGRVKVGDPLTACIDVPPGLGEFCAPF